MGPNFIDTSTSVKCYLFKIEFPNKTLIYKYIFKGNYENIWKARK